MTQSNADAEWDEYVPDGWAETVSLWEWHVWREQNTKLGWRKWGACPRCGHTMAVYQRALRSVSATRAVTVRCNCTHPHEGRPDSEKGGCGPGSGVRRIAIPPAGSE